jgi:hypothetical protein
MYDDCYRVLNPGLLYVGQRREGHVNLSQVTLEVAKIDILQQEDCLRASHRPCILHHWVARPEIVGPSSGYRFRLSTSFFVHLRPCPPRRIRFR